MHFMTDDELFDEIEELLQVKTVYHQEESRLTPDKKLAKKHQKQSEIYYKCLQLIRKIRVGKRSISYGRF